MTYLSRAFWSSLRAKPSGTYVYRGYSAARAASGKEKDEASLGKRSRSASRSRRGSAGSSRSAALEKDKEASLPKRTVSRDQPTIGPLKGVHTPEKDNRGVEGAMNGLKDGLQDVKNLTTPKQKNGLSSGDGSATEEENAPIVRSTRPHPD